MIAMRPAQLDLRRENPAVSGMGDIALFLDLDGTLAPFAATPGEVGPDPARNRLLERLCDSVAGRVAIVSGRTIEDVDRILERSVAPVAGVHGLERRTAAGEIVQAKPHPQLNLVRTSFHALAAAARGLLVEDKGLSIALHYRQSPGCAEAVGELARRLEQVTGLVLQEGEMVAELRTPGPTKGDAVAAFLAEPPFAGALPIYIGDDLTDEDAFAAAAAAGGYGILAGPERATQARWRLGGVDEVLAWLGSLDPKPRQ